VFARSCRAILCAGLLAAFETGCVQFQPRPLTPETSAADLQARSLSAPALKVFLEKNLGHELSAWPLKSWDFDQLTLAAFYYQPSLDVARADWRVAQGAITTAAGRPNPNVSVTSGYDSQIPGAFSPWIPAVTFDVPLETAGKRERRLEQARFLSESARLSIASAAWEVRAGLRAALLDFVVASQRSALLERQVALQRQISERLRQELQAGAIATAETTASQVAFAKAAADLADARSQLAAARVRVAAAIGVPAAALDGLDLSYDLSQPAPGAELTSAEARIMALRGRADVLAALADYAASQSALQLEIAKQYPDVHLAPGYQWNQNSTGDNEWQLGLTVELPLLNQNQGPIAEATARRTASAARFLQLQAKVVADIDSAESECRAGRENLDALGQVAAAQKTQYENTAAQFKAGAAGQLEVLSAQLEYSAAALAELDATAKLQAALGHLEDALQRPVAVIRRDAIEQNPLSAKEEHL
jgi:outer membrane protein TolC